MKCLVYLVLVGVVVGGESSAETKRVASVLPKKWSNVLDNMLRLERAVTNMSWELKRTKMDLQAIKKKGVGCEVSFEVKEQKRSLILGKNEVLKFNTVTLNKGDAYNSNSGIFTAPKTGTYLFWAHVMNNNNHRFALKLIKEDQELARGYPSYKVTLGVASITYVVKLMKGEHVWFAMQPHGPHSTISVYGSGYSSYGCSCMYSG